MFRCASAFEERIDLLIWLSGFGTVSRSHQQIYTGERSGTHICPSPYLDMFYLKNDMIARGVLPVALKNFSLIEGHPSARCPDRYLVI